jgi:hypothetical protein
VEFFTANIRNPHTRRAYARACSRFFAWCEGRALTLTTIRPHDVATYMETLQQTHGAPGVKQQLAAVRMRQIEELWISQIGNNQSRMDQLADHLLAQAQTQVIANRIFPHR